VESHGWPDVPSTVLQQVTAAKDYIRRRQRGVGHAAGAVGAAWVKKCKTKTNPKKKARRFLEKKHAHYLIF
jgi:hypothetical protein